jgi:hypothetical protein
LSTSANNTLLSDAEADGLVRLREEEKLARDVYVALAAKWKVPVFSNTSRAESRHMNAVAQLLERYSITDPVGNHPAGEFTDPEFAKLYDELVKAGSVSHIEAYKVGAMIEDLNIADLRKERANTKLPDVERVYQNLERASRNHLRAFASQLDAQGETYVAKHLTQSEFDAIAKSPREREPGARRGGRGNDSGRGPGWGGGQGRGRGQGYGHRHGRGPGRGAETGRN